MIQPHEIFAADPCESIHKWLMPIPAAVRESFGVRKVTNEGDSEPIGGSVTVQTRDQTSRYDIMLAKGQITLPLTGATCRVDIEPAEM
jgi:hypothetical protein